MFAERPRAWYVRLEPASTPITRTYRHLARDADGKDAAVTYGGTRGFGKEGLQKKYKDGHMEKRADIDGAAGPRPRQDAWSVCA